MKVTFETQAIRHRRIRHAVIGRVRHAMRRMAWIVDSARVRFARLEGPGGPDQRIEVEVVPRGERPVVVTSVAREWREALDQALRRATFSVAAVMRRRRQESRVRLRPAFSPPRRGCA